MRTGVPLRLVRCQNMHFAYGEVRAYGGIVHGLTPHVALGAAYNDALWSARLQQHGGGDQCADDVCEG